MTREDLIKLLNKGKITVTGIINGKGEIADKFAEEDLDKVANQFVTCTGIVDGTETGEQTSDWVENTPPPSNPEAVAMTITGLEEMLDFGASAFAVNLTANGYKGSNVTLYVTATNAAVQTNKGKDLTDDVAWSVKNMKDKVVNLQVVPEDNCETYAVTARLVDDQNTTLAEMTQEFTVRPKALDFNSFMKAAEVAGQFDGLVTVEADIDMEDMLTVGDTLTIDLNGHTLSNSSDLWIEYNGNTNPPTEARWSIISVNGGNLTMKGSGKVHGKANDCYAIDVQNGGNLKVEGDAEYIGNIHSLYVYNGHADVDGGVWSVQQKFSSTKPDEFVLNLYDQAGAAGKASISVTGGSYVHFNPGDNQAENMNIDEQGVLHNSFLAAGYTVTHDEATDIYTVVAE